MVKQNIKDSAEKQLIKQHNQRVWKRIVTILGSIVVFCTTYALILPAVTLSDKAHCGIEEHKHDDSCYTKDLICNASVADSEGHSHTSECYTVEKVLLCEKNESGGHIHADSCIETIKELLCDKQENQEHTHTEECYKEQTSYICGQEESKGHTHETDCWKEEERLICEKKEESSAHTHNEGCYTSILSCEKNEHKHEGACFSNPKADVETASDWEKTIPEELTGDWRKDVLLIAENQLDYRESDDNYIIVDGKKKGYTRYGAWYGDHYGHWCAMFVSFCLDYAQVTDFPLEANCQKWIEKLSEPEVDLFRKPEEHEVQSGDLIFFDYDNNGISNHIGLVVDYIEATENEAAQIKTIEGNSANCVRYRTYDIDDEDIVGYGDLGKAYEESVADVIIQKVYSDEYVTVTASYKNTAEIPEEAELIVKKIEKESEALAYEEYLNQAMEMMTAEEDEENEPGEQPNVFDFQLYDISFLLDGQIIEPKDTVTVEISYPTKDIIPEDAQISVIHYAEEGIEMPEVQQNTVDEEGNINATFETDSFSVYAVMAANARAAGEYTVLFDGQLGAGRYYSGTVKYAGAERRSVTTGTDGSVELPESLNSVGNYPYRIKGWYDIIKRQYYGEEYLGQTIQVTQNTVFYPDYVRTDYNVGQNENVVTNQPDTSDFIETHLFDYNELFNTYSASYQGNLPSTLTNTYNWALDTTMEGSLGFVFTDYIGGSANYATDDNDTTIRGNIGRVKYLGDTNIDHTPGSRGSTSNFVGEATQGIMNANLKEKLFEGKGQDTVIGRNYVGEADWLYCYDEETGYYYYNSALNKAAYNQDAQRFFVYDATEKVEAYGANSMNDFLPFNNEKSTYSNINTEINYWFGMESSIDFYLPADSGSEENVAFNGEDMQFRFSGDDDVWVFVDDELVLDMGGVHDIVYGEINFVTGKYKIAHKNAANTAAQSSIRMPGTSTTNSSYIMTGNIPELEGGKEHTITVYYLERGSTLSNCAIYFNIAPVYELEIVKRDEDGETLLSGAEFKIYDDAECMNPSELVLVDENGNMTDPNEDGFATGANGTVICNGLYPGRTYYIKETKAPEFYPDISNYIIELNLSKKGEPTIILKSTNGDEWIFANAYRYSENGHRIILDVYNSHFIGGEKEVYVEKVWKNEAGELIEPIESEITVHLYGKVNGELIDTERAIILHAGNEWKGSFLHLPEKDPQGNEYEYVVKEDKPSGYKVTYEVIEPGDESSTVEAGWVQVTPPEFKVGEKYLLALENENILVSQGSNQNFTTVKLDDAINVNPETANTYWWEVEQSGEYFYIANGNGRYMKYATSSTNIFLDNKNATNLGSELARFTITNEGRLRLQNASRYFGGVYTSGSYNGKGQTVTASAPEFTLYRWVPETTTTVTHQGGWRITNQLQPEPDYISISVEKQWDDRINEADQKDVEFTLYRVDESTGNAVAIKTITVTEGNNWKGTFEQVLPPEEGMYYCIMENTEEFAPIYSTPVPVILEGQECTMGKVEFDGDDAETVALSVTNYIAYELPETGGPGTNSFIIGGMALMTVAIILLYNKKRGKEEMVSS